MIGMVQELPGVLKAQFLSMVAAEVVIWTPVQYLNFTLMPVQHQQMFVNVVSILEAAIMSWYGPPTLPCLLYYILLDRNAEVVDESMTAPILSFHDLQLRQAGVCPPGFKSWSAQSHILSFPLRAPG
jgi:Mpv17 / PMP22 family